MDQGSFLLFLSRKLREPENIEGSFKLSLTTCALCQLNDFLKDKLDCDGNKYSALDTEVELYPYEEADFINSSISKIVALKVIHGLQTVQGQLDLSRFTNLKMLELNRIPVHLIKNLKELFPQLEVLICNRSISFLKELFGTCTDVCDGDPSANLKELDLSYNYIEELDDTMKILPNLEYLDMSHNTLKHANGIQVLKSLVVINLSYNELDHMPPFCQQSFPSLKILLFRNNLLENLNGLENLNNLEELDISYNCLSEHSILSCLETLTFLKKLNIRNNPLSLHPKHRLLTAQYIHPDVIYNGLQLNGKFLVADEIEAKFSSKHKSDYSALHTSINADILPINTISEDLYSHEISSVSSFDSVGTSEKNFKVKRGRKSFKNVREVEILDASGDTVRVKHQRESGLAVEKEQLKNHKKFDKLSIESNTSNKNLPKHIPEFDISIPLHSEDQNCSNTSKKQVVSSINVSNLETKSCVSPVNNEQVKSNNLCELSKTSELETIDANESNKNVVDCNIAKSNCKINENSELSYNNINTFPRLSNDVHNSISSSSSEDFECSTLDNDFMDIDDDENSLFMVERKLGKEKLQTVFIKVSGMYLHEKDALTGQHLDSLDLRTLQSVKRIDAEQEDVPSPQVHICFDAIKQSRRERIYLVDNYNTSQEIITILQAIIDEKLKAEVISKLQCLKCGSEFLSEAAHKVLNTYKQDISEDGDSSPGCTRNIEEVEACPQCGSTILMDASDPSQNVIPLVADNQPESSPSSGLLSGLISRVKSSPLLNRSCASSLNSSSEFKKVFDDKHQEDQFIARLPSSKGTLLADCTVKAGDKSQMGLQPLVKDLSICHIENTYKKEKGGNVNNDPEILNTEVKPDLDHNYLNECANYENGNSQNLLVTKNESKPSNFDHGDEALSLHELLNEREIVNNEILSAVDHRLKLYLEVKLLQFDEQLSAVLKSEIIPSTSTVYQGLLVMSSKTLYFIKTDSKYGWEEVEKCLKVMDSKHLSQLRLVKVLLGSQGFNLSWKSGSRVNYTCILRDADYCNCFIGLLKDTLKKNLHGDNFPLFEALPEDNLAIIIKSALQNQPDTNASFSYGILLYLLVDWADIEKGKSKSQPVAIAVSTTDLFITLVEYRMSLSCAAVSQTQSEVNHTLLTKQKITNLTCVHLYEDLKMAGLHFLDNEDEEDSCWLVETATKSSLLSLISILKDPWEKSFGIDFPITFCHNCKCVQFCRD